jgi:putative flippase GtrA
LDFVLFVGLVSLGWHRLAAHLVCIAIVLPLSFFGQRIAFESKRKLPQQMGEFLVVTLSNVFLVQPVVLLLIPSPSIAKGAAIVVGIAWNFCWFNARVFRRV